MTGKRHAADPQPELPLEFGNDAMAETLAKLRKIPAKRASLVDDCDSGSRKA